MKILAVQNRMGIGDTVIFLPFIKALYKKFNTPISLLVKENSKADQYLYQCSYIDKIIILERDKKNRRHNGFFGSINLIRDLKKYNFDKIFGNLNEKKAINGEIVMNVFISTIFISKFKKSWQILVIFFCVIFSSCEQKISEEDLKDYKKVMDVRLGHLGNAIIMQGRLLDAFNLRNDRADEDHFKEAEELIKGHLESFGRPDDLRKINIPNSSKLRNIHDSLIEASELLISASNALEDNAWLGGSVSFAERNLDTARFKFQNAVKLVYSLKEEDAGVKPILEHKEYDVGEKPEVEFLVD